MDLSFLGVELTEARSAPRPVNVYDILREGWRETRVDMTLEFFLDPVERHGLGTLVIDALLRSLNGAPTVGASGLSERRFRANEFTGSDSWTISTQTHYIDVLAVNRELKIAIVLENKIDHDLDNPLSGYAAYASSQSVDDVVVVVLAPSHREHKSESESRFLSRVITYDDLAAEIRADEDLLDIALKPRDEDQRRSIHLLQQFMEARTGSESMSDLANEQDRLNQWRDLLLTHGQALRDFEEARSAIGRLLRTRNLGLRQPIGALLEEKGLVTDWEAHSGVRDDTWNAYHFPDPDWTVELKLSVIPDRGLIYVFDRRGQTYADATLDSLDLPWTATDEQIAVAFVAKTESILREVRDGVRPRRVSN